jgi:hypothetical protein
MYQIIHTKSGRKRGIISIRKVTLSLLNAHASRKEAKVFEVTTGELAGECICIDSEKDYWRVDLNGETIRESRTLQLAWLEDVAKLETGNVFVLNRDAPEIRAILNRKHPGVYEVEHQQAGMCSVFLAS